MGEWIKIADKMPPPKEEVEFWWEDQCKIMTGYYHSYDGRRVYMTGSNWHVEEPLYEFTHWRECSPNPNELTDTPNSGSINSKE